MLTSAYFVKIIFPFMELYRYASLPKIAKWLSVDIGAKFHSSIKERTISLKFLP